MFVTKNKKLEIFLKLFLIVSILFLIYLVITLNTVTDKGNVQIVQKEHSFKKPVESKNFIDSFLKEPTDAIKYDSKIPGWKTYYNNKFDFKIEFPDDWYVKEYESSFSFETLEAMTGGGRWGIEVHITSDNIDEQIDNILLQVGNQFEDRNASIENVNDYIKKSTITTAKNPEWFSKIYFVISKKYIYIISNGAKKDDGFEQFFESFEIR